MNHDGGMNGEQAEAVRLKQEGALLIMAGAGSGKTQRYYFASLINQVKMGSIPEYPGHHLYQQGGSGDEGAGHAAQSSHRSRLPPSSCRPGLREADHIGLRSPFTIVGPGEQADP